MIKKGDWNNLPVKEKKDVLGCQWNLKRLHSEMTEVAKILSNSKQEELRNKGGELAGAAAIMGQWLESIEILLEDEDDEDK